MPRNQAPHFKVRCSIANHWKTADIWADPMLRGIYTELGRTAIERYGDRTGDSFILTDGDVIRATGTRTASGASKRLRILCDVALQAEDVSRGLKVSCDPNAEHPPAISVASEGNHWRVKMPNLAKKQFPRREDGTDRGGSASASASASALTSQGGSKARSSDTSPQSPCVTSRGARKARARTRRIPPEKASISRSQTLAWIRRSRDSEIRSLEHELSDQIEAFRNHHLANGNSFADWQRALYTWLRREAERIRKGWREPVEIPIQAEGVDQERRKRIAEEAATRDDLFGFIGDRTTEKP